MTNEQFNELFRKRILNFVIRSIRFIDALPVSTTTRVLSYQYCKSYTSVGDNFRAFCRGRSKNEKFAKICIVVEEADECEYWLEVFPHTCYGDKEELTRLSGEALEILKVTSKIKVNLKV